MGYSIFVGKGTEKMADATNKKPTATLKADTKTAEVKAEVKAETKPETKVEAKAETKTAEVKAEVKKAADKTKATAKKAVDKTKATATKAADKTKATAKKAVSKVAEAAPKKAAVNVHIQFAGKSYTTEDLVKIAKDVWKYDLGRKESEFKTVEIYVKPEEASAYYVINGDVAGSFLI